MIDDTLDALRRFVRRSDGAARFGETMRAVGPVPLADLPLVIDAFVRERRGVVTLQELLDGEPAIRDDADALDVAIHCAIRSGQPLQSLHDSHPDLRQSIEESALLDGLVGSTSQAEMLIQVETRRTPCEFGPADRTGQRRFLLEELLGVGAFGSVYRAVDRRLSDEAHSAAVAVKILRRMGDPQREAAFAAEAARARFVVHPNVVQVFDRGVTVEGEHYLVCELVPGGDLATHAQEAGLPFRPRDAARLMLQIARGVQAAHERGVIHCDLKPSNVLLTLRNEPKVADFGIAVRAGDDAPRTGTADGRQPLGSLAFMPPERYRAEETRASTSADVYALGGMLHWLLTGSLPNGASLGEIHERLADRGARPISPRALDPRIDRDLDAIVRRSLSQDPRARHPTAATFADDLERWLARRPIEWMNPSPVRRAVMWARRSPVLAALLLIAVVGGAGGSAATVTFALRAADRARQAEIEKDRADQERRWREDASAFTRTAMQAAQSSIESGMFNESFFGFWLTELWIGPRFYDDPAALELMWKSRMEIASDAYQLTESRAPGTLVPTIWLTSLGLWQVTDGRPDAGARSLERAEHAWRAMLSPEDPFLQVIAGFRACAAIESATEATPRERIEQARDAIREAIDVSRATLAAVEAVKVLEPRLRRAEELLAAP